jgi:hypothetical protein
MFATRGKYSEFDPNSTEAVEKSPMRTSRDSYRSWGLGLLALLLAAACASPTGPPLTVEVRTPTGDLIPPATPVLQSTTGDPAICCCRVVGTVANLSTVAVHITLQFEAFAGTDPEPTGTAIDFLEAVPAMTDGPYNAVGFVQPCSDIDRVELSDVDLRAAEGF